MSIISIDSIESKGLVLIVDDSKINLGIASAILKSQGYEIDTAENGLEAIEKVKTGRRKFSLVLMDHTMPIMDGVDATRQIKDFDSDLPIVGLTTEENQTVLDNFLNSGLCDVYKKPISPSSMEKITRKYSL